MAKYKLMWIEWHNPFNRFDDDELENLPFDTDKSREIGIKRIIEQYENTGKKAKHTDDCETDYWGEFEITAEFEADNIAKAKEKVYEIYDGTNEVFCVFDGKGKRLFTEEDYKRKLKRDSVVSVVNGKDLVGVYFADFGGAEVLTECNPKEADKIIEIWNKGI